MILSRVLFLIIVIPLISAASDNHYLPLQQILTVGAAAELPQPRFTSVRAIRTPGPLEQSVTTAI